MTTIPEFLFFWYDLRMERLNITGKESPNVTIFERDSNNKEIQRKLYPISDLSVKNRELMDFGQKNNEFEMVYKNIVGNEELEVLLIKGIKGSFRAFAELNNKFTLLCVNLSDSEIDNIVRKFRESILKKFDLYVSKYELNNEQIIFLQTGVSKSKIDDHLMSAFNLSGIKSVISFIRFRKKIHEISPKTIPSFYFENYLDSKHKIDLIELVNSENGFVLNLIQIKSHEYSQDEIEKYKKAHLDWINGNVMDLSQYEKQISREPEDKDSVDSFMSNATQIEEIFLDIFSGTIPFSKDVLFEKLGLGNRPNVEKVWILNHYLTFLKEELVKLKEEGYLDEDNNNLIKEVFKDIEDQLEKAYSRKRNLNGISEVYSICATGKKEFSKIKIFEGEGDKRKVIKVDGLNN